MGDFVCENLSGPVQHNSAALASETDSLALAPWLAPRGTGWDRWSTVYGVVWIRVATGRSMWTLDS